MILHTRIWSLQSLIQFHLCNRVSKCGQQCATFPPTHEKLCMPTQFWLKMSKTPPKLRIYVLQGIIYLFQCLCINFNIKFRNKMKTRAFIQLHEFVNRGGLVWYCTFIYGPDNEWQERQTFASHPASLYGLGGVDGWVHMGWGVRSKLLPPVVTQCYK